MDTPLLLSLVYFATFIIYVFFSIYVLLLNPKAQINRVFFLIPFNMAIWSFAFSIANNSPNYDTALFWRRVAAIGWGSVFSCILHFIAILTLTEEKYKSYRRKYFILYVPAVINIIVFCLYGPIARLQYNLVLTRFGWTNVSVNNYWDWFYNFYYISCICITIVLLIFYGIRTTEKRIQRQSLLLILTFFVAFILGSITDIFLGALFDIPSVQTGPIVILIPVLAFYIVIKRYGLINVIHSTPSIFDGNILTIETRIKMFSYLAFIFTLGSLLSFAYQFFIHETDVADAIIYNGGFFIFGVILYTLLYIKATDAYKDFIMMSILIITIPYAILRYSSYDASITVWSVPFIFILLSILFTRKRILISLTVVSVITMIIIMIFEPTKAVVLQMEDHILRIFFLLVGATVAFYVQSIYIQRLKENEAQTSFHQLLSTLFGDLLLIDRENYITKIPSLLEKIGNYTQFDHVYFLNYFDLKKTFIYEFNWNGQANLSTNRLYQYMPVGELEWLKGQLLEKESLFIQSIESVPSSASDELEFLLAQNAKSGLFIQVMAEGELFGILGMDSVNEGFLKSTEEIKKYRVFGNLFSDLFQKINIETEINQLAYYDHLTKLPNRIHLLRQVETAIERGKRENEELAILFIDLDTFKMVNDSIGHSGGDELLKVVSGRIKQCLKTDDILSRFSGDEFVILIYGRERVEKIDELACSILNSLRSKISIYQNEFMVTSSIGIATYPDFGNDTDTLIRNADFAMYEAKVAGKNSYRIFTQSMEDTMHYRNKIITHLQYAIEKNEMEVFYQPQVDIQSGAIIGFEALLRWNNRTFGYIPPSVFIPVAEKCGLIKSIGEWVFKSVCIQSKIWENNRFGNIPIAINISSDQFRKNELIRFIKDTISETKVNPKLLEIEITEGIAIRDVNETIEILEELKSIGIQVSIDDFGTEYSSLSRLKDLPIDRVKIAMDFIHGIGINPKDEAIIKVIIYLSKSLGLKVIAEGVETIEQFEFLQKEQCDDIQGYYFYRPMNVHDVDALI